MWGLGDMFNLYIAANNKKKHNILKEGTVWVTVLREKVAAGGSRSDTGVQYWPTPAAVGPGHSAGQRLSREGRAG